MAEYTVDATKAIAPLVAAELTTAEYMRAVLAHMRNEPITPGTLKNEVWETFVTNWDAVNAIHDGAATAANKPPSTRCRQSDIKLHLVRSDERNE